MYLIKAPNLESCKYAEWVSAYGHWGAILLRCYSLVAIIEDEGMNLQNVDNLVKTSCILHPNIKEYVNSFAFQRVSNCLTSHKTRSKQLLRPKHSSTLTLSQATELSTCELTPRS